MSHVLRAENILILARLILRTIEKIIIQWLADFAAVVVVVLFVLHTTVTWSGVN